MNKIAPIAFTLIATGAVVTSLSALAGVILAGLGLLWQLVVVIGTVWATRPDPNAPLG